MSKQRFTVVPTDILFSPDLSPPEKLLYAVMSSYGQRGRGVVWPSQDVLSSAVGVTQRQLRRLLSGLEAGGLIVKKQTVKADGHFGRNEYELLGFAVDFAVDPAPSDTSVLRAPSDIHVRHRRTFLPSTVGHPCPVENKNMDQEQKNKNRRFTPPSEREVQTFFQEKGCLQSVAMRQASKFVAFYESKGWTVGKSPMKSWRAAASGWLQRGADRGNISVSFPGSHVDAYGAY